MKKKLFVLLLVVALMLCAAPMAFASEDAGNHSFETATPMTLGTGYTDNLGERSEYDYFAFTLEESGYINIHFSHDYVDDSDILWEINLYNSNCEWMKDITYAGNTMAESVSDGIGLPAGTYYLRINRVNRYSSALYKVSVDFTPSTVWEQEFNDSFGTANTIATGIEVHGNIMESGDEDYYVFTLEEAGNVTITFNHEYVDDDYYNGYGFWLFRLYDANSEEITNRNYSGETAASETTTNIGLPAGTYYLKWTDYQYHSTLPYSFSVNYTAASDWETEFNDSFGTADVISTDTLVNGSIMDGEDEDYYTFTLEEDGYISYTFTHEYVDSNNSNNYWLAYFYNADKTELFHRWYEGNTAESSTFTEVGLPAGTYYLKITDTDYYTSYQPYSFIIEFTPASDWETEFNDSHGTADSIVKGTTVYGSHMKDEDIDFYKFTLDKADSIGITFNHEKYDDDYTWWKVYLYDANMEEVTSYSYKANSDTVSQFQVMLEEGTYYIAVKDVYADYLTVYSVLVDHAHIFGDWTLSKEPTCTAKGEEISSCVCGETQTREVAPVEHTRTVDEAVAATCTTPGKTQGIHCSVCKTVLVAQETIPVTDHTYKKAVTKPTCTKKGYTTYTCTVCGDQYVDDYTDVVSHTYGAWSTTKAATVAEEGTETRKCSVCGKAQTRSIAKLSNPFVDVSSKDYFYNPVMWAVSDGVTSGLDETHFGPGNNCTRAQIVTFLWAAAGKPAPETAKNPFVDVKKSDWYYNAVLWAVENGITSGLDATHFGPNATCTRAQTVMFLYAAVGRPATNSTKSSFSDVKDSDWFCKAVLWAVENEVTAGVGNGKFGPGNTCTRGQIVTFLYKTYE